MGKGKIKGGRGDKGEERIKGEGIKLNLNSSRLLSLSLSIRGRKSFTRREGKPGKFGKIKTFFIY